MSQQLLQVRDLKVHFPISAGTLLRKQVASGAVRSMAYRFSLARGETLGLVGESGCGKSTTGLAILKMQALTSAASSSRARTSRPTTASRCTPLRRRIQMVYQDPYGSLNPRMTVRDIIGEPLVVHGLAGRS